MHLRKNYFQCAEALQEKERVFTLKRLQKEVPEIMLHNVPCGTKVFDWTIPEEWKIEEAYIEDSRGKRIVDYKANNLHIVGYSIPVDEIVSLEQLNAHIYSLPDHPDWIPYVTSYYKERWDLYVA